jgi:hypothetical protein
MLSPSIKMRSIENSNWISRNVSKSAVNIPLHLIQISRREEQRLQRTAVPFYVGFTEQLHGLIDADNPIVIVLVL